MMKKVVKITRTSSGDIIKTARKMKTMNEVLCISEQSKYSLETQRILYGISCLS